jgi:hypothetical protein
MQLLLKITELVHLLLGTGTKGGAWQMGWIAQMSMDVVGGMVPLLLIKIHLISEREMQGNPSTGTALARIETGGSSGRKLGLDELERQESQRESPVGTGRARETPRNRDLDRERAVAEAKVWGENWREKKRANAMGSFDGTYE